MCRGRATSRSTRLGQLREIIHDSPNVTAPIGFRHAREQVTDPLREVGTVRLRNRIEDLSYLVLEAGLSQDALSEECANLGRKLY
jgi:hypothetical protein